MKSMSPLPFLFAAAFLGASGPAEESPARESVAGNAVSARVDSEDARLYRDWLLQDSFQEDGNPTVLLPSKLAILDRQAASSSLGREQLQELTQRHSVDLATLLFARSILADPRNAALNALFTSELTRDQPNLESGDRTGLPKVVFAPGFLYRSHPETGADFAVPRRHLSSLGIVNELIETKESGAIEENATRIAMAIRQQQGHRIIIVSASKAGPEVALALGRLLEPMETRSVAAWINIGGLLGGSPLADQALRPPRRWLVRMALWWNDLEFAGIRSLRTSESRRRLSTLSIPADLPIVSVVAAPLSGDVSKRAADGYRKLRQLGPNDGLALLADQIPSGSRTLLLLGDDHFHTHKDPRVLTLALLATARHVITPRPSPARLDEEALSPPPASSGHTGGKRNQIALEQRFWHPPI